MDCGQYWGFFTQLMLQLNPNIRLWAFNPTAPHREWAARSLHDAGLGESDVCVAPYALGTKATHGYMGSSAGSGLLNWGVFDQENTNDNEIRAVSFRNWLAGLDADVHVFKLEAMGIELELLECARDLLQAGRIKHLLTYAHDGRFDKLMQLLPTLGFVPDSKLAYDSKPGVRGIIAASWAPVGQRLRYE